MSDEQKEDRDLQLLVDDSKGAFSTLERFESETIVRWARLWNIHPPKSWGEKDVLSHHERRVLSRLTNEAINRR